MKRLLLLSLRLILLTSLVYLAVAHPSIVPAFFAVSEAQTAHNTPKTPLAEDVIQDAVIDFQTHDISLNQDYTYTENIGYQARALSNQGVIALSSYSQEFFPDTQSLEVTDAYVTKPDGTKSKVDASNIFVRPSAAAQDAPGFTSAHTLSIEYPGMTVGSQVNATLLFKQKKPSPVAFSRLWSPNVSLPTKTLSVRISAPSPLEVPHASRGAFEVKTSTQGNRKILSATFTNAPQHKYQGPVATNASMGIASPLNFLPVFMISDGKDWDTLGADLYNLVEPALEVSPAIQSLSDAITKGKKGLDAVAAVYNWVTQNIRYVSVTMNPEDGLKPNKPDVILTNGYGDCKDYVALTRALLKAQGIKSQAVAVNYTALYNLLPLPSLAQFDHQILYLPEYKMFANPTNTFAELGVMGLALDGKKALIYAPEGELKSIPIPKPQDSLYSSTSTITLDPSGNMRGTSRLSGKGFMLTALRSTMATTPATVSLANIILQNTLYGGYGSVEASSNPKDLSQPLEITAKWQSPHALEAASTLSFMIPEGVDFLAPRSARNIIIPEKPLYPFVANVSSKRWHYKIIPPKGYTFTEKPKDLNLSNSVGTFTRRSWVDTSAKGDATLHVALELDIAKVYLSPTEYKELRSLIYGLLTSSNGVYSAQKIR